MAVLMMLPVSAMSMLTLLRSVSAIPLSEQCEGPHFVADEGDGNLQRSAVHGLLHHCITMTNSCTVCQIHDLVLSKRRLVLSQHDHQGFMNLIYHASRQRAELEANYSSVRPCVRPPLGKAQNIIICFCTIQTEIYRLVSNHVAGLSLGP